MANRRFTSQFNFSFDNYPVRLDMEAAIGAAGAVSNLKGSGIKSIAKTGTGQYKIVLDDPYRRLMNMNACMVAAASGTSSGIDAIELVATSDVSDRADPHINIQTLLNDAVANAVSGSTIKISILLSNASNKQKGE